MTADESLEQMQHEYGLLLNAQVSFPMLQAIVRRILAREIQREEQMRDLVQSAAPTEATLEKPHD